MRTKSKQKACRQDPFVIPYFFVSELGKYIPKFGGVGMGGGGGG